MKKIGFWSVIFIILLISIFILETSVSYKRARWSALQKDCYLNIRKLALAVETYNIDHPTKIDTILPGRDYEDFEKILIKERYFPDILYRTEEKCSYGIINFSASETVFCKRHGIIDGPAPSEEEKPKLPEYNTSLEKPFSMDYEEKQIKHLRQKQISRKIGNFLYPLLKDPGTTVYFIIITLVVIAIIRSLMFSKKKSKE